MADTTLKQTISLDTILDVTKIVYKNIGNQAGIQAINNSIQRSILANLISPIFSNLTVSFGMLRHFHNTVTNLSSSFNDLIAPVDNLIASVNRIKASNKDAQQYSESQILRYFESIANNSRGNISDIMKMSGRLAFARQDLTLFDIGQLSSAITKAMYIGGSSGSESRASLTQFLQSLGSGYLQGDELRSIRENAPGLLKYLSAGLQELYNTGDPRYKDFNNVNVAQLKELGKKNQLTTQVILQALKTQYTKIDETFTSYKATNHQLLELIQNKLTTSMFGTGSNTWIRPITETLRNFNEWLQDDDKSGQTLESIRNVTNSLLSSVIENGKIIANVANGMLNLAGTPLGVAATSALMTNATIVKPLKTLGSSIGKAINDTIDTKDLRYDYNTITGNTQFASKLASLYNNRLSSGNPYTAKGWAGIISSQGHKFGASGNTQEAFNFANINNTMDRMAKSFDVTKEEAFNMLSKNNPSALAYINKEYTSTALLSETRLASIVGTTGSILSTVGKILSTTLIVAQMSKAIYNKRSGEIGGYGQDYNSTLKAINALQEDKNPFANFFAGFKDAFKYSFGGGKGDFWEKGINPDSDYDQYVNNRGFRTYAGLTTEGIYGRAFKIDDDRRSAYTDIFAPTNKTLSEFLSKNVAGYGDLLQNGTITKLLMGQFVEDTNGGIQSIMLKALDVLIENKEILSQLAGEEVARIEGTLDDDLKDIIKNTDTKTNINKSKLEYLRDAGQFEAYQQLSHNDNRYEIHITAPSINSDIDFEAVLGRALDMANAKAQNDPTLIPIRVGMPPIN